MIVELIGLPGAGKTTFAKRLAESGEWSIVTINGFGELLFYNALFFLRHPIVFFRTLVWLCRYLGDRKLWYTKFVNLFIVHNAKYMKAGKYPRAIIGQGHYQNTISLFDERVADKVIDCYAALLPKPDLLVFFAAPDEIRTKRLSGRGYGTRDHMSEEYREAWGEAREAHFERLYVSRGGFPYATETVSPDDEEQKLSKLTHARIWCFVLHGRMPTEKAHGLQTVKTLEALTKKGAYATLWVPRGVVGAAANIAEYYGVEQVFSTRSFSVLNFLSLPALFGPLRFWFDALGFFFALLCARIDRTGVFYTRSPELAWLFKMKEAPVWYEAHLFPSSKVWLLKFFLAHIDGIIANSKGTADSYLRQGFHDVRVVRNGVDRERFLELPDKKEACALLQLPQEKTLVMYVGAFYEWKGVPFLLETWQKYFFDRDDLLLVLVGGNERDLQKHGGVEAYRIAKNVLLIPHAHVTKVPLYLAAANVLVLPNVPTTEESIRYTSPIKLFEYMASGKPIIAADLPSIREVLGERAGILFRAGESDALAESIAAVLCSPESATKLGEEAQREAEDYSWDARAQLLMNIVRGHAKNRVSHAQFLKTMASGGLTAILFLALVYIFTEYIGLWYAYSVLTAYGCALMMNFILLKLIFVGGIRKIFHEFFIYFLFTLANLFVNEITTYVLVEQFNMWYMLAQFLIVGTLAVVNFFIYRSYVFRTAQSKEMRD